VRRRSDGLAPACPPATSAEGDHCPDLPRRWWCWAKDRLRLELADLRGVRSQVTLVEAEPPRAALWEAPVPGRSRNDA